VPEQGRHIAGLQPQVSNSPFCWKMLSTILLFSFLNVPSMVFYMYVELHVRTLLFLFIFLIANVNTLLAKEYPCADREVTYE
jgi:hypothetical protein